MKERWVETVRGCGLNFACADKRSQRNNFLQHSLLVRTAVSNHHSDVRISNRNLQNYPTVIVSFICITIFRFYDQENCKKKKLSVCPYFVFIVSSAFGVLRNFRVRNLETFVAYFPAPKFAQIRNQNIRCVHTLCALLYMQIFSCSFKLL